MITHHCEKINILSISNLYNIMKFQFIIERSLHYEMNVFQRNIYTDKLFMSILFYLEFISWSKRDSVVAGDAEPPWPENFLFRWRLSKL